MPSFTATRPQLPEHRGPRPVGAGDRRQDHLRGLRGMEHITLIGSRSEVGRDAPGGRCEPGPAGQQIRRHRVQAAGGAAGSLEHVGDRGEPAGRHDRHARAEAGAQGLQHAVAAAVVHEGAEHDALRVRPRDLVRERLEALRPRVESLRAGDRQADPFGRPGDGVGQQRIPQDPVVDQIDALEAELRCEHGQRRTLEVVGG